MARCSLGAAVLVTVTRGAPTGVDASQHKLPAPMVVNPFARHATPSGAFVHSNDVVSVLSVCRQYIAVLGCLALTLVVVGLVSTAIAQSQVPSASTPAQPSPAAAAPKTVPPVTMSDAERVKNDLRILELEQTQNKMLLQLVESRAELKLVQTVTTTVFYGLGLIFGLFAIGGIVLGWWSTIRTEGRATQLHELTVSGEVAAQGRSEFAYSTFLDASQRTLTLVNETLALAKEASDRAAKTLVQKAQQSRDQIDYRAKEAMNSPLLGPDFKVVVEDAKTRTALLECARDLQSIEGYLQLQDIELTPLCYFVKGMERHLRQEAEPAIRCLNDAAQRSKDDDLRAFSLYWIGYERNNIGRYSDAAETFRRAIEFVAKKSPREVELRRIEIESRFFELANRVRPAAVDEAAWFATQVGSAKRLYGLLDAIDVPNDPGFDKVRRAVQSARGNILTWAARPWDPGPDTPLLQQALEHFKEAGDGLYPLFGQLEAQSALRKIDRRGYERVIELANDQLPNRMEPRTLVSLYETRLIAQILLDRPYAEMENTHRELLKALKDVDNEVTIFSQIKKCNISRDSFGHEVEGLAEEIQQRLEQERAAAGAAPAAV